MIVVDQEEPKYPTVVDIVERSMPLQIDGTNVLSILVGQGILTGLVF